MNMKAFLVVAILVMSLLTVSFQVLPQETEQPQSEIEVRYMFVQTAHSGSFVPVADKENLYTLTLEGVSPQTIAFSDRPERVVGQVPMQQFLDGMDFTPENAPNAAIEILGAKEEQDVAVVELFDPVYDAANQTLQYAMSILEQPNLSYAVFNERHDKTLPATFGPAVLYVDDCPDCGMACGHSGGGPICNHFSTGQCWCWKPPGCFTCKHLSDYDSKCAEKFGSDCGDAYCDDCGCADDCP